MADKSVGVVLGMGWNDVPGECERWVESLVRVIGEMGREGLLKVGHGIVISEGGGMCEG